MSASVTSPGATQAWLKDQQFDLSFIVGIALLASAMSGATVLAPALFLPMLTAHIWLFGYDHLVATYTKLMGRPADRAQYRRLILYLPPEVLLLLYAIGRTLGTYRQDHDNKSNDLRTMRRRETEPV